MRWLLGAVAFLVLAGWNAWNLVFVPGSDLLNGAGIVLGLLGMALCLLRA